MSAGETGTARNAPKGYSAHYLAQKFGITPDQAREGSGGSDPTARS